MKIGDLIDDLSRSKKIISAESKRFYTMSKPNAELSTIGRVYDIYDAIVVGVEKGERKRLFVLVCLYLYSPRSLCGDSMLEGLRDKLAYYLDSSPTMISKIAKGVTFEYMRYAKFRKRADTILDTILTIGLEKK